MTGAGTTRAGVTEMVVGKFGSGCGARRAVLLSGLFRLCGGRVAPGPPRCQFARSFKACVLGGWPPVTNTATLTNNQFSVIWTNASPSAYFRLSVQ